MSSDRGFTLVEILTALVILSILGLMSYRGLAAVVDAKERVANETATWRSLAAFFERFEHDLSFAAARPVRGAAAERPAFIGQSDGRIEFSRFASGDASTAPQRIAYALNTASEIELRVSPVLDAQPEVRAQAYPALAGVTRFELQFLGSGTAWLAAWPAPRGEALPRAVRVRVVLSTGEEIVRVFAVQS